MRGETLRLMGTEIAAKDTPIIGEGLTTSNTNQFMRRYVRRESDLPQTDLIGRAGN
jgi:hypothetical protein